MQTNRRNFVKTVVASAALAAVGNIVPHNAAAQPAFDDDNPCTTPTKALLNLSFQEGTPPGKELNEKLDYMEKLGIVGFEPGGRGLAGRVNALQQALRNRNIKVSAICAGFRGWLLANDAKVKADCINTSKEILAAAGELGSVGMILVPAFNSQQSFPHTMDTRKQLIDDLRMLADFAHQHNTRLILEPLNRSEAFYLRLVADAAAICRDVNSPGIACLGDFWHMTWEETSDCGAFLSADKYLKHVHIASRKRRSMPGEDGDADNYIDGFKGLKMINYQDYVSFECGSQGNREQTVPAAVALLRQQWDKA